MGSPGVFLIALIAAGGLAACGADDAVLDDTTPVSVDVGPDQPDAADDGGADGDGGVIEADGSDAAETDGETAGAPIDAEATDDAPLPDTGTDAETGEGAGNGDDDGALAEPPDEGLDDPASEGRSGVAPPDGSLTDLATGATTDIEAEIGDGLTLLWFWSTESSTAEREAVVVQRYADTFADAVGVVAVGTGGDQAAADAFRQSAGLEVTTLWSVADDAAAHYEVDALPQSLLIDGEGNIIARWPGLPQEAFALTERIS